MYNRELEVREAIYAGERALQSLEEAKRNLSGARGWGVVDLLGGGSLSGLLKHMKIGDARQSVARAKSDLAVFSRELSDVKDLQYLDIDVSGFLTFADFFFDGLIADVLVQSKIKNAQRQIDEAIVRVHDILGRLREYR